MTPDEPPSTGIPGPGLQPPGTHLQPVDNRKSHQGLIWSALALVIILGLGVLFVLPKMVSDPGQNPGGTSPPQVTESPAQLPVSESEATQDDAQQALQEFLRTRARLEVANAMIWGEPEWSQAIEAAEKGNNHFSQRQFAAATEALTTATGLLNLLESERGQRLTAALESGWQALEVDDSRSALAYFELAKAMDEGSLDALEGLERARVRPDVLRLMASGGVALSNDDLALAQETFSEAVSLDVAYEPAVTALQEVSEEINERSFNDAMSRALSALEMEQVDVADAALKQAASLKPDAEVVKNTRWELVQVRQKLWLQDQRRAVELAESKEDWSAAVAIYDTVLTSMPQTAFARQGHARARDRQRLHQQLDHYLLDPTRVYSDQPRANAERLLESAANPPAGEVLLAEKINQLQALITLATTPTTVTLNSDGLTSVQIYHVGRLGQFVQQQVELRPGTYTVVGSRPGYRDVRYTLTVKPGAEQPALDIRCEESV